MPPPLPMIYSHTVVLLDSGRKKILKADFRKLPEFASPPGADGSSRLIWLRVLGIGNWGMLRFEVYIETWRRSSSQLLATRPHGLVFYMRSEPATICQPPRLDPPEGWRLLVHRVPLSKLRWYLISNKRGWQPQPAAVVYEAGCTRPTSIQLNNLHKRIKKAVGGLNQEERARLWSYLVEFRLPPYEEARQRMRAPLASLHFTEG